MNDADRGRRKQPAVAARADMQDVLREDRQQRRRRRKERREEVEQHRRSDQRRAEHEPQAFDRRCQRHVVARPASDRPTRSGTSRIISSATITKPNDSRVQRSRPMPTPVVAITSPASAGPSDRRQSET